jgi:peptidoglycan/xylan/chitin deacetylase (PgdA/CDA1 family)
MATLSLRRLARLLIDQCGSSLPRRVADGASLVLCYHNIVEDGDAGRGDASLHLSATAFELQLRVAGAEADLVSLPELLATHGTPGRRIAVTFDDAYRGCLRLGLPLCQAAGVRPTIFLAPALFGAFAPWDVFAEAGRWTPAHRAKFLEAGGITTGANIGQEPSGLPMDYSIATEEALKRWVANEPVDLANHTDRHVNLARTEPDSARAEITRCEHYLAAHFPTQHLAGCLAFPYGLPPGDRAAAVLSHSVRHAFLVSGGWVHPADSVRTLMIPRLNVPAGLSIAGFKTRLRGWST